MSGLTAEQVAENLMRQGVWKAVIDKDGLRRTYYYNSSTKERVWDLVSHVVKQNLQSQPIMSSQQPATEFEASSPSPPSDMISSREPAPVDTKVDKHGTTTQGATTAGATLTKASSSIRPLIPQAEQPRSIALWNRRDAVQHLTTTWSPTHQQSAMAILMWLSLFRWGGTAQSTDRSPQRHPPQDSSSLSSMSYIVVLSCATSGGTQQQQVGCYQATFVQPPPQHSTQNPSTDKASFQVHFSSLESQHPAALSIDFDHIVLVEEFPKEKQHSMQCWALVRDVRPANLECVSVFTLLTPAALNAPWSICSWKADNVPVAIERSQPPRPPTGTNNKPSCQVLKQSSCSTTCSAVIQQSVDRIRHRWSILQSLAQNKHEHTPSKSASLHSREGQAVSTEFRQGAHIHLHSLLEEALASPRPSPHDHQRVYRHASVTSNAAILSRVAKPRSRTPANVASRTSTAAVLFPASSSRRVTSGNNKSPTTSQHQDNDLFNAIMHQLDAVAGIISA